MRFVREPFFPLEWEVSRQAADGVGWAARGIV